jgi:IS605 OrfB family transposase
MEAFSEAFRISAEWGYKHREKNKFRNQMAVYGTVREQVPKLPSALVINACHMATEALVGCQFESIPRKGERTSIRYPWKGAKVNLRSGCAMLLTIGFRVMAEFKTPTCFDKYLDWKVKCSYLYYEHTSHNFFLNVALENDEVPEVVNGDVLGIDRGLKNLAVCSNNAFFNSKELKRVKGKYAFLRAQLQAKGTHSAKRKLKKIAGKEKRFVACENHKMAKEIVAMPYSAYVLEDLRNIRNKSVYSWQLRRDLATWPHYQFQEFLQYKAEETGKELILIDGSYTSQTCSKCGNVSRENRKGSIFKCTECEYELNADLNASRNIAQIGIAELGRLHAGKPNAACNESGSIRGSTDDERSCKSILDNIDDRYSQQKTTVGSTTSFNIECGWTGTRLGGYKPSKREMSEKGYVFNTPSN